MKSIISINNQSDVLVYTVPIGKKAVVFVDIWAFAPKTNVVVKINNYDYFSSTVDYDLSIKLILDSGDNITISSTGQINVFVHGLEV